MNATRQLTNEQLHKYKCYFIIHTECRVNSMDFKLVCRRYPGDSSGANLAAAITLKLRVVNWRPRLKLQVLIYPPLQTIDFMTPSYQEYVCDSGLTQAFMRDFWSVHLNVVGVIMSSVVMHTNNSPHRTG